MTGVCWPPPPGGCRHCGWPETGHDQRDTYPVKPHDWAPPTAAQTQARRPR